MHDDQRFAAAIRQIDAANQEDPETEIVDGTPHPREWLFARCVYGWIEKLLPQPSEAILLAARGHTVRRWHIPRDRYPMDTAGYHQWRDDLAAFHADETGRILAGLGYPGQVIARVQSLITRENWSNDPEGRALEDADCLAFLEKKLHKYRMEWETEKAVRILRGTLAKMTPKAVAYARELDLDAPERTLLTEAGLNKLV